MYNCICLLQCNSGFHGLRRCVSFSHILHVTETTIILWSLLLIFPRSIALLSIVKRLSSSPYNELT